MMDILNVFTGDAFGMMALTEVVMDITPQYGRLTALGLFQDEGVSQRVIAVDFDTATNVLLPQTRWGGPPPANKSGKAKTKGFSIPHFPIVDELLASDLQGRRRPGSDMVQDAQYATAKKLGEMKRKLEQTGEWMRLGVLKGGLVQDGLGATILDIYTDFGLTQDSTSMVFATTTTDILGKIAGVKRVIQQALRGEMMTNFVALCSDTFYDALVSHANVKIAFTYFQNNGQTLNQDFSGGSAPAELVKGFQFGGVTWLNYTGSVSDSNGNVQLMIDAGSAYMFPMGTQSFKVWYAPADYMETVNTEGLPFYAKQERMKYDKGIEMECQSNLLPICLKPKIIQKLTIA